MIKFSLSCLVLCTTATIASANTSSTTSKNNNNGLTRLATQAITACENETSQACKTWKGQLKQFILKQPNLSSNEVIRVADKVYQEPFAYFGKLFFLENVEQIYFNSIKQHHINYLKKPDPDALPEVNQTYQQSLKDLQYLEKNKSRYIETMCAPIRTVWAGGRGMDSAYAECKAEFIGFNVKFLINTWNEMKAE